MVRVGTSWYQIIHNAHFRSTNKKSLLWECAVSKTINLHMAISVWLRSSGPTSELIARRRSTLRQRKCRVGGVTYEQDKQSAVATRRANFG